MNFTCFKYSMCCLGVMFVTDCYVQGLSTKYSPQRVGVQHLMKDEDVIQIIKKWQKNFHLMSFSSDFVVSLHCTSSFVKGNNQILHIRPPFGKQGFFRALLWTVLISAVGSIHNIQWVALAKEFWQWHKLSSKDSKSLTPCITLVRLLLSITQIASVLRKRFCEGIEMLVIKFSQALVQAMFSFTSVYSLHGL